MQQFCPWVFSLTEIYYVSTTPKSQRGPIQAITPHSNNPIIQITWLNPWFVCDSLFLAWCQLWVCLLTVGLPWWFLVVLLFHILLGFFTGWSKILICKSKKTEQRGTLVAPFYVYSMRSKNPNQPLIRIKGKDVFICCINTTTELNSPSSKSLDSQ